MFFLYFNGAVGITHLDNFNSKSLCEKAAHKALLHVSKLENGKAIDIDYVCVLEIN